EGIGWEREHAMKWIEVVTTISLRDRNDGCLFTIFLGCRVTVSEIFGRFKFRGIQAPGKDKHGDEKKGNQLTIHGLAKGSAIIKHTRCSSGQRIVSPHSGHFIPGKNAPGMKPHFKQMDRISSMVVAAPWVL
ncbi:MAG: hypothetical protein NZ802_01280, partial [Candidatus Poseidoniales archaeon]|nr:hypothetical protein [Candidatus Poseidoniales archaeon]